MNSTMSWDDVFATVQKHVRNVIPELESHPFSRTDSLRELGANSLDRADIVMDVMEELALDIPRIELLGPRSIGELVDLIHEKLRHT